MAGSTSNASAVRREVEEMLGLVPAWFDKVPEPAAQGVWRVFRDFELAETKIPNKYKELIGLGVSGATRCRYCALFHTEAARLFGATDEEIAEASQMAGVTMMLSTFINAEQMDYAQFKKEVTDIVTYVKKRTAETSAGKKAPQPAAHA